MTAAPAVNISGYSHVTVMVDDLDAALAFYCDRLGFEVLPRPDFGGRLSGAWLRLGSAQVHLGIVDEMAPRHGLPHMALYVPAEEWDATLAALRERGIAFDRPESSRVDFDRTVRAAFISDPAGNVIELTDVPPV